MKNILLTLLFFPIIAFSQNCEDITKEYDEFKQTTLVTSPKLTAKFTIEFVTMANPKELISGITVAFVNNKDEENPEDFFLKLDNGTIITLNATLIKHDPTSNNEYLFFANALVDDMLASQLKKNKIIIVRIGKIQKPVDDYMGTELMRYANCVFSISPKKKK